MPLAKKAVSDAGLYVAEWKDLERLAQIAMDAYRDYPLHNWFTNGRYDREASKRIMEVSLRTMIKDGVIYGRQPTVTWIRGVAAAGLYRQ